MKNLCREYTLPRSEEASRVRGWILGNTKVGPVLDVKVCLHQRRYGIEILIESLFRDRTVSRVRIVNGVNKYVSETSETISLEIFEHKVTVKLVAKAKPQPKPAVTLSSISIPVRERKWIDINPERFRQDCFAVSKAMIRLLRHNPSISREDNGAVRLNDIMWESKAKFDGTSQWPTHDWITFLAKGGGPKKRFQYCLNPNSSKHFVYFRAIQGHSGGTLVDPALQDNVQLPEDFTEYIHHVGNVSGIGVNNQKWIDPRRKKSQKGQAIRVFRCSEPDGRRSKYGRNSMRLGQTKDRSTTKILGGPHQKKCIGAI